MNASEVSIIIPSLNPEKHELTKRALSFSLPSIFESTESPVIVAYNGDGTGYPQGQCAAVNNAVRETSTKWVMICNNDMVFAPNTFARLIYAVDHFGLLVASPNLVEPQKGAPPFIEKFCGGVGTEGTEPNFDKKCFLDFAGNYKEHPNKPYVNIEDGFNLPFIIRRDVWDAVGGYDDAYDPWGANSDSDLQYRIMLAGITPKRVRDSLVYHFSQISGTFHPDNRPDWERNQKIFRDKFGVERASSPDIWFKPSIDSVVYKPPYLNQYASNN